MKYTLSYERQDDRGDVELNEDGTYYIACGDEGVHVFSKPTRGKHVVLIAERGAFFVMDQGAVRKIAAGERVSLGDMSFIMRIRGGISIHVTDILRGAGTRVRRHAKPIIAATTAAALIGLIAYIIASTYDDRARDAVVAQSTQTVSDDIEKARKLKKMRYKLAEKALAEGHAEEAVRILDKIVAADARDGRAAELKQRAVRQAEEERQQTKASIARDTWIQRTIAEATRQMDEGDLTGAQFTVKQVLAAEPDHARAAELRRRIRARIEALHERRSMKKAEQTVVIAETRDAFLAGSTAADNGQWTDAYRSFKKAADRLAKHALHPDFELDLHERLQEAKAVIDRSVRDLLARAEERLERGTKAPAPAAQSRHFRRALKILNEADAMSGSPDVARLRQRVVKAFDAVLEPLYVEAVTLQELEGCCFANARFKQIKKMAHYPEVHHFKASELAMSRCPCTR